MLGYSAAGSSESADRGGTRAAEANWSRAVTTVHDAEIPTTPTGDPSGCVVTRDRAVVATFGPKGSELCAVLRDLSSPDSRQALVEVIDSALVDGVDRLGVPVDLTDCGLGPQLLSVQVIQPVEPADEQVSQTAAGEQLHVSIVPTSVSEPSEIEPVRLDVVFTLVPVVVFIVDEDDRLVHVNQRAAEWFGLPPEELVGRSPDEIFGSGDARRDTLLSSNQEARETGYVSVEISRFEDERSTIMLHKSALEVEGRSLIAAYGIDGAEASADRSRASAREMQLGRLVDLIPAPIWVINRQRRIMRLNGAARALATTTKSALVGSRVDAAYPLTAADVFGDPDQPIESLSTEGHPATMVFTPDGSRAFRVDRTLLSSTSDTPVLAVMLTELTDVIGAQQELQVKNEVLEHRNIELDQFAHMASHDLRAPLRAIYAFTQMALEEDGDEHRDHLGAILGSVDRMRSVLDSLLDYATTDANPTFVDASLNDVVASVLGDLASDIAETHATIKVGDLPSLRCDETSMRRLFQNLIANAMIYCGDAPPSITITSTVEYRFVEIIVTDRGVGFPQDRESEIFRPFKRLSADSKGQGIGLSMCRRIVESHHGTIRAISKVGGPTSLVIRLPRRRTS